MQQVVIVTRDLNGKRNFHYPKWDEVCDYVAKHEDIKYDEILAVLVEDYCFYSGLQDKSFLSWGDLVGFFA